MKTYRVWAALTDYAAMPQWWPAVKAVRSETRPDGDVLTWNMDSHGKEIAFRTREEAAPERLVREIVGDMPILVPGIGAQGATMEDCRVRLAPARGRILPNVSRELIGKGTTAEARSLDAR